MAKLTAARNIGERAPTVQGKRPRLGGNIILYPNKGGDIVAATGRRKSFHGWTDKQRATWRWLFYSAQLYKIVDTYIYQELQKQSLGLWLQPRDIFTANLAGRLFYFEIDGRLLPSWKMRRDMSYSLDILGDSPGMMLYRGSYDWLALAPGGVGQVLKVGASGLPVWSDSSGDTGLYPASWRGAVELYAIGQGHALDTLPDGRRAIRLYGNVSGTIEALFYVSAYVPAVSGRALLSSMYAPSGDYVFQWKLEFWARSGFVIASYGDLVIVSGIPSGESRLISSPAHEPPNLGAGYFCRVVLSRVGGDAADTSTSQVHLLALGLEG